MAAHSDVIRFLFWKNYLAQVNSFRELKQYMWAGAPAGAMGDGDGAPESQDLRFQV